MSFDDLNVYLLSPIAQVALIIGIAEIAKRLGLNKKYIPVLDVVVGVLFGILTYGVILHNSLLNAALIGVALGLSACGLFSGIKNTMEGFTHE